MKSAFNVAHFANEAAAIEYVETRLWPDGPVCPHCGTIGNASRSKGKTTRLGMWNCRSCRKPFTVKIGTVFESSHVPLHVWLQVIYLFCSSKKGFATRQIQRTLQCSMKTAWFLGHRVREAMADLGFSDDGPLGGQNEVVESDETWVGGKAANRKNRIPKKQIVLSLVQRGGKVRSFHVPDVTAATFVFDSKPAGHGTDNHSAEEYVRAYFWHTNTVENYFSLFKRAIYGCFFHVSEAHLHRYAAERDFIYNHRIALGFDDQARSDGVLKGAKGKRLTYRTTRSQQPDEPPF
jgi:transposase-like protein